MPNCSGLPFDYVELNKSCAEQYNLEEGWSAQRIFYGDWAYRFDFIDTVFAKIGSVGGQQVGNAASVYPDIPAAKPHSTKIQGKLKVSNAGTDNQLSYEKAHITVDYKILPFNIGGLAGVGPPSDPDDPNTIVYITEEFDTEIEMVRIPSKLITHYIEAGGPGLYTPATTITETIPERVIMESIINYRLTHHFISYPSWNAISAALGKVNSFDFYTPSGLIAPPGTILYNGPSGLRKHSTSRNALDHTWEITHDFKYNRHNWNFVYDAAQDRYVLVVINAGTPAETYSYKGGNLDALFQPAQASVSDIMGRNVGFVGHDPELDENN